MIHRHGLLVRDVENSFVTADAVDADNELPMNHLLGSSIIYRLSRSTICQYIAKKRFPASIPIGVRTLVWYSEDIEAMNALGEMPAVDI